MTADIVQPDMPANAAAPAATAQLDVSLHERLTRWRVELHTFSASIEREMSEILETLEALSGEAHNAPSSDVEAEQGSLSDTDLQLPGTTPHEAPAAFEDDLDEIDLPPARPTTKDGSDPNRLTALKLRLSQQMATTEQAQRSESSNTQRNEGE